MKRFFKIALCLFLALITALPMTAYASGINTTLTFAGSRRGWLVRTQDAFLPGRNITTLGLNTPQSMVFGSDDLLYIADTGNRRIVVFDTINDEVFMELAFEGFVSPRGVFVTPGDWLYVADAGANSIFIFDALTGEHLQTHGAPTAMAFANTAFAPNRIAVDVRGNMFIVGEGVFDGIIQLSSGGEFLGFFAANQTSRTFVQMLQDLFFTDRQREGLMDRLPSTFSNVTVDSRGVIYSTSIRIPQPGQAFTGDSLQRHDMAGRNTFQDGVPFAAHIDVCVDDRGFIYTISGGGWINVFTNRGEFIFYFGAGHIGNIDIAGMFRSLVSIAVSSQGHIWALDDESMFLQSFTPTEYALLVFDAITLFNAGLYQDSAVVWNDVLRHNQMSTLAHNGLGRAFLQQQQFEEAMESFFLGGSRFYYSAAFWEVRNQWLMDNLTFILLGVAALVVLSTIVKLVDKKRVIGTAVSGTKAKIMNAPLLKPVLFAFSVARHPLDSYYDMKSGQKGTLGGALFHFVLFFIAYMLFQTSRGFIVQMTEVVDMDFVVVIGGFFGVFILFVLSNYLVTSINDGEGGIKDIFKLVSYGIFPLTITLFAATIFSHVLTENEIFLYNMLLWSGVAYAFIVIWLGLQEVHSYGFGQTLKGLLLTIGFMLIALVVLFNLTILFNEVVEFFESIFSEVRLNVQGLY